jgi:hypothetical protein
VNTGNYLLWCLSKIVYFVNQLIPLESKTMNSRSYVPIIIRLLEWLAPVSLLRPISLFFTACAHLCPSTSLPDNINDNGTICHLSDLLRVHFSICLHSVLAFCLLHCYVYVHHKLVFVFPSIFHRFKIDTVPAKSIHPVIEIPKNPRLLKQFWGPL